MERAVGAFRATRSWDHCVQTSEIGKGPSATADTPLLFPPLPRSPQAGAFLCSAITQGRGGSGCGLYAIGPDKRRAVDRSCWRWGLASLSYRRYFPLGWKNLKVPIPSGRDFLSFTGRDSRRPPTAIAAFGALLIPRDHEHLRETLDFGLQSSHCTLSALAGSTGADRPLKVATATSYPAFVKQSCGYAPEIR
jgi:hypothetical protein